MPCGYLRTILVVAKVRTLDLPTMANSLSGYLLLGTLGTCTLDALCHMVIYVLLQSRLGTYPGDSHCADLWALVGAVLSHVILLVTRSYVGKEYFATDQRKVLSIG